MMRLNLQLTMGTFSLSLFGLMGVAFGMNLESSFEEVGTVFLQFTVLLLCTVLLQCYSQHCVQCYQSESLALPDLQTNGSSSELHNSFH